MDTSKFVSKFRGDVLYPPDEDMARLLLTRVNLIAPGKQLADGTPEAELIARIVPASNAIGINPTEGLKTVVTYLNTR